MWFKVDDSFWSHPKVIAAGNPAIGLWVRCGSYAAQHMTDGFIPGWLARQFGTPAQVRRLVTVGLWTPVENPPGSVDNACGYLMHDWPDYQPTKQTALSLRANAAERQRRFREKQQVNGTRNAVTDSAPTRPVPEEITGVVAHGTGRHARPAADENRELAAKQVEESRNQRAAKETAI